MKPATYGWRLWRGWNVWTKTECELCGSMNKVTSGKPRNSAGSIAWKRFALPRPGRGGWTSSFNDPGLTTEVSQVTYGHRARKRTWLYAVGVDPAALDWRDSEGECIVGDLWHGDGRRLGRGDRPRMYQREALSTPPAFRDVLLDMARSAGKVAV